jgi:GxxExxY protein
METDFFTQKVIGCAIEVHKELGPGLLESSYECCLMYELAKEGILAKNQVVLPINYKGVLIESGYRIVTLLPEKLIIELKVVDSSSPIHTAQMISYLKSSDIKSGLLINFNMPKLTNGPNISL